MSDLLTDTLAREGGEPGQEGMLTPAQIIAQEQGKTTTPPEQASPPEEPKETPPPENGKPPAPPAEPPKEVSRDALLEKLDKNPESELTEAEKAELAVMQIELAAEPPPPEPTFNIAGKVFTQSEIDQKMRDEYLGGVDLSPERLAKAREYYVKAQNREQQHLQVQKQQEVNAAERQAVLQAKLMLQQDLDEKKERRERLRRETELMKARAAMEISEQALLNPETGVMDPVKFMTYQRKVDATERLPQLEQELVATDNSLNLATQELVKAEINALATIAPQYRMQRDIITAWKELASGTLSADDKLKVLELDELVRAARSKGIALEDEYAYRRAAGTLAIKPPAQPVAVSKPRLPELPTTTEMIRKAILAYKKKAASAPPNTAGSPGATRPGGEEKSLARQLVEHGRTVLGTGEDKFLDDLGYGSR